MNYALNSNHKLSLIICLQMRMESQTSMNITVGRYLVLARVPSSNGGSLEHNLPEMMIDEIDVEFYSREAGTLH